MEDNFAVIVFVQITPHILIPYEWPICNVNRIVLDLAKEIIAKNYEDSVLQVNGIPARLCRYVDQHGSFYVFKKILSRDISGCYVYDITLFEDINNSKVEYSSGTCNKRSRRSDDCSCSGNYTLSFYQVPPCIVKQKVLDMSLNESKIKQCINKSWIVTGNGNNVFIAYPLKDITPSMDVYSATLEYQTDDIEDGMRFVKKRMTEHQKQLVAKCDNATSALQNLLQALPPK